MDLVLKCSQRVQQTLFFYVFCKEKNIQLNFKVTSIIIVRIYNRNKNDIDNPVFNSETFAIN